MQNKQLNNVAPWTFSRGPIVLQSKLIAHTCIRMVFSVRLKSNFKLKQEAKKQTELQDEDENALKSR